MANSVPAQPAPVSATFTSRLAIITRLAAALSRESSFEAALSQAMDALRLAIGADRAAVLLFGEDDRCHFHGWQGLSEGYRAEVDGHSPWSPSDLDAKTITVPDAERSTDLGVYREPILREGIRALAFIPLVAKRRLLGKFMVYYDAPNPFPSDDIAIAETIAREIVRVFESSEHEAALSRSEAHYRQLVGTLPVVVFQLDRESRLTFANRAWEEFTGHTVADSLHKPLVEFIAPEWHAEIEDDLTSLSSKQITVARAEIRLRGVEGLGARWVELSARPVIGRSGEVVEITGSLADVTEQRRATDRLLAERRLFVGGPTVVWRWKNQPGWPVEYVSQNLKTAFGYSPDAFTSGQLAFAEAVHPDDLARVGAEVAEHAAQGSPFFEQEYRLRHADGSWRWLYDFTVIERDDAGAVTHFSGYVIDITARREAELEQQRMRAQLQQAQKLESLGVLAGGIAHDFNNLLMGVMGNAELALRQLRNGGGGGDPVQNHLDDITVAAQRAADLTRQLLAYSGRGRFVVEPVDLSELIQEMAKLLATAISKKAELDLQLEGTLPLVDVDATQIRQVVMNLITNASDAMPSTGGKIAIRTGVREVTASTLSNALVGRDAPDGRYVFIEVADDGAGISAEHIDRIFDPFFTTKSTGRGLGLAAVIGIVRGHHGVLFVESELGKGSRFTLLLTPSQRRKTTVSAPISQRSAAERRSRVHALVIDDDAISLGVTARMLQGAGHTVTATADPREALRIFQTAPSTFGLVVLDLTMPGMSGFEAFRELRKISMGVRVIVVSGFSDEDAAEQFADMPPAAFLQKPFRPDALLAHVDRIATDVPAAPASGG